VTTAEATARARGRRLSPSGAAPAPPLLDLDARRFLRAVSLLAGAVALVLLVQLRAWPPHEDETLALYVGQESLRGLLETVLGERGGAPLHFLLSWLVAHAGGGITELRLLSAAFAVAAVPLVALIAARLTNRRTALVAAALASASWMLLFHGVYARMYSLFLFTSALSYLALLAAAERGGRRPWALWVGAALLTVATHPYGALVLASQGAFVLIARARVREAVRAFAAVAVLGIPFWIADLTLAGRFDVGVGGGGEKLGDPLTVVAYLGHVAGDFSAGWLLTTIAALGLFAAGLLHLWTARRDAALLVVAVLVVPTAAFVAARLGAAAAPETRHLIFALPFFWACAAVPVTALARRHGTRVLVAALALACSAEVAWAWSKTPELFTGEPTARVAGRAEAARWLGDTGRPDDVLLGYDPVFARAWEEERLSRLVLPRADAKLALEALREAGEPLGRGVWVFDAWDTNNVVREERIGRRLPWPAGMFEARAFGPYLVVRTRTPTGTARRYLERAAAAQVVGKSLGLGDADINFATVARAAALSGYAASRPASRSTSSR
jgi:hypothetical protein